MRKLALGATLWPSLALAGTVDLTWQVRLLDAAGAPIDGDHRVEVRLVGDADPAAPEDVCFSQVTDPVSLEGGFATVRLANVPESCFDAPRWVAVLVGSPAAELGPRAPVGAVPVAARADTVDGMDFGASGDPAADIKAYVDRLFCERASGTWVASSGTCDPNMVVGSGSYNATSCPSGYRVCSVPEVQTRAFNVTPSAVPGTWYWASHEAGDPNSGNLDKTTSRFSYPYCPNSGDAPLVLLEGSPHGGMRVRSIICYTSGYLPLCCR